MKEKNPLPNNESIFIIMSHDVNDVPLKNDIIKTSEPDRDSFARVLVIGSTPTLHF